MQQGRSTTDPAIYVTANALMTGAVTLDGAIQIAKEAGADGFELRPELLPLPLPPALGEHIRLQLQQFSSPPAYSLPRSIFTDGAFERKPLLQGLGEVRSLGCRLVKFSSLGVDPAQASQHPGDLAGIRAGLRELRALLRVKHMGWLSQLKTIRARPAVTCNFGRASLSRQGRCNAQSGWLSILATGRALGLTQYKLHKG